LKAVIPSGPQGPEGFSPPPLQKVRVWDAPTRLFHWALAAAFAGEWLTRDARYIVPHEFLGYAIGLLVLFRLVWGFTGTRWARFASFPLSISAALAYLRGLTRRSQSHHTGHNPAGSWAIYALLALAAFQVASGIVTLGAEQQLGPLAGRLSYSVGDTAHELHESLAWAMLAVVGLHLVGVVVGSLLERENLVGSMLTGLKRATAASAVQPRRGVAFALAAMLGMIALAFFRGDSLDALAGARVRAPLTQDASWKSECGSCHMPYHPSLLPARSWSAMWEHSQDHFGEDLALQEPTAAHLAAFAAAHAADALESNVAWKIATTTPAQAAPLRVSETPYWKKRHARLDAQTWKSVHPSECNACHRDAESGAFSPRAIEVAARPAAAPRKAS